MANDLDSDLLRVASLNLWAQNGDWPARRSMLASGLADLRADVISFQETIVTSDTDQIEEILGEEYSIVHQRQGRSSGLGISIASRWPVRAVHEVDLHVTDRTTASFPCALLAVEVDAPEPVGSVLFANHFPNPALDVEYERELQAVRAAGFLEELRADRGAHVIVAGDLDADPASASVRYWTGRQSLHGSSVCYRDAWESAHPQDLGHTFTPEHPLVADQVFQGQRAFRDWPFRRVDYIFVRLGAHCGSALSIRSCEKIFDHPADNGIWASDHVGITADLIALEH